MILYEYADFSVASYQGDMRIKHSLGGSMCQGRIQAKIVKNKKWDKNKNSRHSEWFLYPLTLCKDVEETRIAGVAASVYRTPKLNFS